MTSDRLTIAGPAGRPPGARLTDPERGPEAVHAPLRGLRVALAHDWLVDDRGGERVLGRMVHVLHEAGAICGPIYALFSSRSTFECESDDAGGPAAVPVRPSALNALADRNDVRRRWLLPFYPGAIEGLGRRLAQDHQRDRFDLLVSTSSCLVKNLRAPAGVPHVCYCHSPPRYLWTQRRAYGPGQHAGGVVARARAAGLAAAGPWLCRWDRRSTANAHVLVANSRHTRANIREIYGREARVLHPPIDVHRYTPAPGHPREDFWLVVSALEPYKRVELSIEAAVRAGRRLLIVGRGTEEARLRRLAANAPGIEFLGRVPADRMVGLYRSAAVLLAPQIEDFGMVAAEAMACGCPVAARDQGGALDVVDHGRTGVYVRTDEGHALAQAAMACERLHDDPSLAARCRQSARRFAAERFDRGLLDVLLSAIEGRHAGGRASEPMVEPKPLTPEPVDRADALATPTAASMAD